MTKITKLNREMQILTYLGILSMICVFACNSVDQKVEEGTLSIYNQRFDKIDWLYNFNEERYIKGPGYEIEVVNDDSGCSINFLGSDSGDSTYQRFYTNVIQHSQREILFVLGVKGESYKDLEYLRLDDNNKLVGWCIDSNGFCCIEEKDSSSLGWYCSNMSVTADLKSRISDFCSSLKY